MDKREFLVFSGNSNPELAEKIAKKLGMELGSISIKRFSDGEIWVKYTENIRGREIFIIQSTNSPSDNLMELLIMLDAAKRASAKRITAVIPYFGYARQDRKDQPRVSITAKLIANLITTAGADRVMTMDLHAAQIQGFFDIPFDHIYASIIFTPLFRNYSDNLVVVAPDVGGIKLARAYARRLKASLVVIDKRRPEPNMAEAMNIIGNVEGKDVLLVDDIIDTGGTFQAAIYALKNAGAKKIFGVVTHAILSGQAIERIASSPIEKLYVSDTIRATKEYPVDKIEYRTVADIFAEAILRTHKNESISSLFEIDKD